MLSEHFSKEESVVTDTGLVNEMPESMEADAVRLAETILEPLRVMLGPLHINSWYRSQAVNKAVGGVDNSYHRLGLAADVVPTGDVFAKFKMAVVMLQELPIDLIIWEHHNSDWIHVQAAKSGVEPRHLAMISKLETNGHRTYMRYDP